VSVLDEFHEEKNYEVSSLPPSLPPSLLLHLPKHAKPRGRIQNKHLVRPFYVMQLHHPTRRLEKLERVPPKVHDANVFHVED